MAIFRKVNVTFWKDEFIESLTPEQKFFYLYLMTNDRTTQCGIYEITIKHISFDTGYNEEKVKKLIVFFSKAGKIKYSDKTKELALKNWVKYNYSESPKVKSCIDKELKSVKDRVLIQYLYCIDTHPQEEEEEEQEEEQEEDGEQKPPPKKVVSKMILFKESSINNLETFTHSFLGSQYEHANFAYYFEVVSNWAASKAEKKIDWIAAVRGWMARDLKDGKFITNDYNPQKNVKNNGFTREGLQAAFDARFADQK